jgi:shikimate kinase
MSIRETDPIYLTGFMGAGKTSVGQELARRLKWMFVDLDRRISQRAQRPVAVIFEKSGEPEFRKLESETLADVVARVKREPRTVVALGGGTLSAPENLAMIRSARGVVIALLAPIEEMRRRCDGDEEVRPLFADPNRFRELLHEREPGYRSADLQVDTGERSISEVVSEIVSMLNLQAVQGTQEEK